MRIGRLLAAAALTAGSLTAPWTARAAEPIVWDCGGNHRPLGTLNGPGVYEFRPGSDLTIRYVSQGGGSYSASHRTDDTCTTVCVFTNAPQGRIDTCEVPHGERVVVTITRADALVVASNPASQPAIGVPLPEPLPSGPILVDPGCDDCSETTLREAELPLASPDTGPNQPIVVSGERDDGRYAIRITRGGDEVVPQISVEDHAPLPEFAIPLGPESDGGGGGGDAESATLQVIARWHADDSRCLVAIGDPEVCGPAGHQRVPRDADRWQRAGLLIRIAPSGPAVFVPYLGQLLCAGHSVPDGPSADSCG